MEARLFVFLVLLGIQHCVGLPVNKAQLKEKQPNEAALGMDVEEYMRYWDEMARNDPCEFLDQDLLRDQLTYLALRKLKANSTLALALCSWSPKVTGEITRGVP